MVYHGLPLNLATLCQCLGLFPLTYRCQVADPWPKPRHVHIVRQLSGAKLPSFRRQQKTALGTKNKDRTAAQQDDSSVQIQLVVGFVTAILAKLIKTAIFSLFAHCHRAREGP